MGELLITLDQQECNTPTVPHLPAPTNSGSRPSISQKFHSWSEREGRRDSLNVPPPEKPASPDQRKKDEGRFRETLPSTDGRDDKDEDEEDGDGGSSKQREFCVISDLKLERTCQGSHERRVDHIAWWNVCVWYILLVWGMAAFQ